MEILFNERVKQLRQDAGLSQLQLAQILKTTQRKVSYWETAKIEPSLKDLVDLSEYFDVSTDYLIGKKDY